MGLPMASTRLCILVLNPPRERPIAWSSPTFFRAGTMLVGAHDGAVDHRILIVGIKRVEDLLPHTGFRPSAKPAVEILPAPKAFWEVTPRDACTVAVEHRLDKQTVVCASYSYVAFLTRQKVADTIPLVIAKRISSHGSAPKLLNSYESAFLPRRNLEASVRSRGTKLGQTRARPH